MQTRSGRPPATAERKAEKEEPAPQKALTTLPFVQFALVCAAWNNLQGKAENGYMVARRVSDTEVVLSVPDKDHNDNRVVVTLPQAVAARVRPYDLDEG